MFLKKIFFLEISDKIITAFAFVFGAVLISFMLFSPEHYYFSSFTIYNLVYFWIKALAVDIGRIKKKEKTQMPGFVYWVYGLEFAVIWMIADIMNTPFLLGQKRSLRGFFYHQNPFLFWLGLEVLTSIVLFPLVFLKNKDKTTEGFLIKDFLRYFVLFSVFELAGTFFDLIDFAPF